MSYPAIDNEKHENQEFENKPLSDFDAEVERHHLSLRGKKLTAALAFVAGTGFTLFGCVCYLGHAKVQLCLIQ